MENSQQARLMANDAASPQQKLNEKKRRLEEAKVNFQESVERLNAQLVLVKDL
jgi:hypothetical protein